MAITTVAATVTSSRIFGWVGISGTRQHQAAPTLIMCSSTAKGAEEISRRVNMGCKLVGCVSAVPSLKVSNNDLAKIIDTSDEWISVQTGIRNRRVLSGKENLTDLSVEAARKALEMAEVNPKDVDLILMCSSTGDDLFGSAPLVQKALGCNSNPLAFDITAACSGFLLGLFSASCYIKAGGFKNVLVIGADAVSRFVDWTDRGSCILFGDAAGAVLVQACDIGEDGLFGFDLHSDGDGKRHLISTFKENETDHVSSKNHSVSNFPPKGSSYSCLQMNGREIFKFAVRMVPQSIEAALEKAGLCGSDFDWLLLHQVTYSFINLDKKTQLPHVIYLICMGLAASMGSFILVGGEITKRLAFPHAWRQ